MAGKGPGGAARRRGRYVMRLLALAAIALGGVALSTPPAEAAKVDLLGGRLTYVAAPGEGNWPKGAHFDAQSGEWTVADFPELMEAGSNCEEQPFAFTVSCSDGAQPLSAFFELGDGDDYYYAHRERSESEGVVTYRDVREPFAAGVDGGTGRDDIWAAASGSPISLSGGEDADRIIFFPPEPGDPQSPQALYRLAGEGGGDWLQAQIGPGGADPTAGLQMDGGSGADVLRGSPGPDEMAGGPGEDEIWDSPGNDSIGGGDDADRIYGAEGSNVITGGGGGDELMLAGPGSNLVAGEAGDDTINVRNIGYADDVGCGEGSDRVRMDTAIDLLGSDCEYIELPGRCPRGRAACPQTVTMIAPRSATRASARRRHRRRGLILGRARTRISRGTDRGLIPLSAAGRAFIARRGAAQVWRVSRVVVRRRHRPPLVRVRKLLLTLRHR